MNRNPSRGAALLLVLWLLLLVSGLVAVFALTARTEAMQGSALRQQVAARHAAEAGIELAALRMWASDPIQRWVPDGRTQAFEFEGYRVEVRVQDEAAKVDLNAADAGLFERLMLALGLDESRARQLAGAIQDWRDTDTLVVAGGGAEDRDYAAAGLPYGAKDAPFATVQELQQVLGMDFDTYRLLVPHVTVHAAQPRPLPEFAQGQVLAALGLAPSDVQAWLEQRAAWRPGDPLPPSPSAAGLAGMGSGTYSVASRATRPDGSLVEVTATLRMGAGAGLGRLYGPLAWRVGEPD